MRYLLAFLISIAVAVIAACALVGWVLLSEWISPRYAPFVGLSPALVLLLWIATVLVYEVIWGKE